MKPLKNTLKKLPDLLAFISHYLSFGLPLRYFCQDETRWGLKTLGGRVITLKGVKPTLPVQWPRETFYTYGVVEPLTGKRFFFEFSHVDSTCYQLFLDQFAAAFPESLNVMQLDNGSFHKAEGLEWPDNVIPLFQSPHSPELNPIERLWQYLKSKLRWDLSESLEVLKTKVSEILNALTDEEVRSIVGWDYITSAVLGSSL